MSLGIQIIIMIVLIFIIGSFHTVNGEKNKDTKNNTLDSTTSISMTIPLPFNSHIADQTKVEKTYLGGSNLPFP